MRSLDTVEVGRDTMALPEDDLAVVLDLPGAYGLDAVSPDEELTGDLVPGGDTGDRPHEPGRIGSTASPPLRASALPCSWR